MAIKKTGGLNLGRLFAFVRLFRPASYRMPVTYYAPDLRTGN